MACVMHF